jgi:hypothetical protein
VGRSIQIALVSWVLSALLHGASLVALGLLAGGRPLGANVRQLQSVDLVLTLAADDSQPSAVQLVSFEQALQPSGHEAPELLTTATSPSPAESPAESAAVSHEVVVQPRPAAAIVETQLFGVRGRGNRFVYVFDRSASMEGAPLVAAKRELVASLAALTSANQFQVIFYNQAPQAMPSFRGAAATMAAADELGKRQAANFIGSIYADGATNHLEALRLALSLRPDVVFLLTDANEPRLSPAELSAIRQLNRHTSIHTIEFGAGAQQGPTNFLEQLAMENGGQHTYIDVTLFSARVR